MENSRKYNAANLKRKTPGKMMQPICKRKTPGKMMQQI